MSVTRPSGVPDEVSSIRPECHQDTVGFKMTQTMIRIRDPVASLNFYTTILGMSLLQELHFEKYKFSLYFVGYCNPTEIPSDPMEHIQWGFNQQGVVELTHNWKTEKDPNCKYHNGNDSPQGFGHIGITVPDVYAACKRFEDLGVKFRKKPNDGNMKGLAFVLDPDGYSIEVLSATQMAKDPLIVGAAVLPTSSST
eukprot:211596_1